MLNSVQHTKFQATTLVIFALEKNSGVKYPYRAAI